MFKGSFVALVTPFKKGKLDEKALKNLVRWHLESGTDGLVPCGSTGEASTLSPEEYLRVIEIVSQEAGAKIPVVAGCGTNSTSKTQELVQKVSRLKVQGLLVIVPYYNKPTQEGMVAHFKAVSSSTKLPIIVYNIPGRTGVNMIPQTLAKIRKECGNIAGVKEASGSLDQVSQILNLTDPDFCLLSGDDSLTLPMMAVGARGVISVVANLLPKETHEMCDAFLTGEAVKARQIHHRLLPLVQSLFVETNPIPVKAALGVLKRCSNELRLPLTPLSAPGREKLLLALKGAGLLS